MDQTCVGSGCGTVDMEVASNARRPLFESSQKSISSSFSYCELCAENARIVKKRQGMPNL